MMNGCYAQLIVAVLIKICLTTPLFSAASVSLAKQSLERLMEGNQRYVTSATVCHEDWTAKRAALLDSQTPFAIILACSDSRVPPEIIFDQTLGALFVIRVAGNVVDDFALGSIEYGASVLGAELILVLGHAGCGAVDAALKGLTFDNHIQEVLTAIQPAVRATQGEADHLLEKTIKANVKNVEKQLRNSRPVLAQLLEEQKLQIFGAYYHLESGQVEILDQP